jgi:hypothetical protein
MPQIFARVSSWSVDDAGPGFVLYFENGARIRPVGWTVGRQAHSLSLIASRTKRIIPKSFR